MAIPINYSEPPAKWESFGSSAAERVGRISRINKNRLPVENLSYNEVEAYGFGKSRFDEGAPEWALSDLNEWRAQNQTGLEQIANGIIKGAITTGTTFVDVLAGIPTGIMTAAAEGRLSGIWDNAVTNAMQSVTDWSEEVFPNYYTNSQQNAAWYAPENLFSANFLGDKLIKNFGFSAGAGLGMKVVSRIPKLLPKLIKNANIARAINTAETSFVGAVGEGSIEALTNTKEWAEQNRNIIESERSQNISLIDSKYNQLTNDLIRQYGNSELAQQLISNLSIEYQREVDAVNNTANQKVAALQNQIDKQGNLILAGNIPILFGSNLITLGKMMAHGYGATQSSTNGFVKSTILDNGRKGYKSTLTSARQALRYAKTPIAEGLEEMNQAVISTAAKNRAQDYYNMSIDPDATDATKSYMGYIWDSFKQTYGDIDNYEDFVVGMIASGISDIVVGQGKALHDERKQINDAVNRANNAINNFNNRTLLRNMNVQQVLEDQKLDAALRNDKKEYKDSEFGQIASAVIAFSQIGKIDDLKAMIDANLSDMSDEDLETLANDLKQESSDGAEYNAFKLMSNQQRREYLAKQKATYDKVISNYNKIREDLVSQTGSTFTPEQQAELIFYKLRVNNAKSRIDEINSDIDNQILNNTSLDQQTLNKLGLKEDKAYTAQEVLNAVKEFDHSDKQLANLFKGQPVEQLFLDRDRISKDINKFNDLVIDFITNPQKLEKKNNKIAQKINDIFTLRKVNNIIDNFSNADTYSSFASKLNDVDPKLQSRVLDALIKRGVKEAKQFKEKTTFSRYASKFLSESDADPAIVNRAAELISEAVDKGTKISAIDLNNPLYSKENNSDLSEEDYNKLFSLLGDVLNHSNSESAEPITKKSPLEKEPVPTEESEVDSSLDETADRVSKLLENTEEEEEVKQQQPKPSTFVESTEETQYKITEENTKVLGIPLANNNGNNTDKDIDSSKTNSVEDKNTQPSLKSLQMGLQEIDTKKYRIDDDGKEYPNPYIGIPVIEQRDKDGKLTKAAKELTPLYNKLNELGVFDNVRNGIVKVDSKIFYAIDPTLKGDHVVEGETVTYNDAPILLYVDDKCVGSLTNEQATSLGIREKLEEEFAGSSDDSIHVSKRYFTIVKEIWAGRIKYEKEGSWPITNDSLNDIKERMAGPDINANDVNPIITVFDPNSNAFVNSPNGVKYHLGQQVSDIFEDKFYKGSVVLLVPTAAYDSTKIQQPDHAFMPVRLERIKAESIDPNSKTRIKLRKLIRSIFNENTTAEQLDKIVGDIKQLITYNYHISPTEEVSVHIDPGAMTSEGKISPTTNHSYFKTNNLDQAKSKFTYIILKYKVGNNNVKTFTMNTHLGNVKKTSSLSKETIDQYVQVLEDVFLTDLNSYVNINKNELIDPKYVQELIDDNILRTNVKDFTIRGDSFTMEPIIHDIQSEIQQEEPKQPKIKVERQPETKKSIVPDADDDIMSYNRRESLRTTPYIIDIDKEVNEVMRMLPQLDRDTVFETVKTLIDINESDDKAMGQFFEGIVKLSELAESGTAYHEAYHLVFNMILKPEEVNKLLKEYGKKYPDFNPIQLEEQMAEDFRDYAMTRESRGVEKGILSWFKRLAELVKAFFDGRYYFETVASKIWRSKYAGRELHPTWRFLKQQEEIKQIKDQAIADGTFMKAPNGNPTNLNEMQWLQVRTKAFKEWFGDWENDPKNASKVVDENGEPLVVYHRSPKQFNKFDFNKLGSTTDDSGVPSEDNKLGFFFTSERHLYDDYKNILGNNIYEVFLNIKKPQSYMPITMNTNEQDIPKIIKDAHNKYDGIKYVKYMADEIDFDDEGRPFSSGGRYEFVIFNPNQIKSATDNIGTFSRENDDIRYRLFDMQVYEDANGATVNVYRNTYNVEDLSIDRFQRLVDNQVNNIAYNNKTKSVDMNNQWGKLVDRWKLIGVNISGHKSRGKYTVSKVELDYNNVVMRNIEQYKQNRNRTLLDEKMKQCEY